MTAIRLDDSPVMVRANGSHDLVIAEVEGEVFIEPRSTEAPKSATGKVRF
jgi:hypothetical protein